MKYQLRIRKVDAVQWKLNNFHEIIAICPDAYLIDSGWTVALPIPEDRRYEGMVRDFLVVHGGNYVVRDDQTGASFPMTEAKFQAAYEEIT